MTIDAGRSDLLRSILFVQPLHAASDELEKKCFAFEGLKKAPPSLEKENNIFGGRSGVRSHPERAAGNAVNKHIGRHAGFGADGDEGQLAIA